jgi:hypothetical protein
MPFIRARLATAFPFVVVALLALACPRANAQAAMLMEEPFGFFGFLNPTGHDAVYFERICAETPVKVRRCAPGELGAVITRYQGIAHYDWIATPLLPYLYAVESPTEAPAHTDHETVNKLRDKYHDAHLQTLGDVPRGDDRKRGWSQFVGVSYERRIYAFRVATTEAQDDALIARMNAEENRSRFNLITRNCADFTGGMLNFYFPDTFRRSVLPDFGITTPRQISYKLVRYARKHPELQLTIFDIPQVPGYRRHSSRNQSISEAFLTRGYAFPFAFISPYIVGGFAVDYLIWGRYPLPLKGAPVLTPESMDPLRFTAGPADSAQDASSGVSAD